MTNAIQANHIVDRIATETELVIDSALPQQTADVSEVPPLPSVKEGHVVRAMPSGYVQLVALEALANIARARRVHGRSRRPFSRARYISNGTVGD